VKRKSKSEDQEFVCDVCDVAMLRCCDAMFAIDAIDASDLTENGRYRNTMFIIANKVNYSAVLFYS